MITVGQMVKQFGLARSTLLYYDSIGLLKPSKRSRSGYRLYSETDIRRMEQVQTFRKAGLALE
ncbi:MAG: MerR family transcriptional regulator, partial [bacterium]|nr:MerR family transcriptional regulator [bacterium]